MNPVIIIGAIALFMTGIIAKKAYDIKEAKDARERFYFYDTLFKKYGNAYGFNWKWLKAIAKQESDLGLDSRVINGQVSGDGLSYGLMQIAEGVGSEKEKQLKGYGGKLKLNDPEYSISVAAKLVDYLNKKYLGDKNKIFLAYNQGEINTDKGKDYTVNYSADRVSYKDKINKWLAWLDEKDKTYQGGIS